MYKLNRKHLEDWEGEKCSAADDQNQKKRLNKADKVNVSELNWIYVTNEIWLRMRSPNFPQNFMAKKNILRHKMCQL